MAGLVNLNDDLGCRVEGVESPEELHERMRVDGSLRVVICLDQHSRAILQVADHYFVIGDNGKIASPGLVVLIPQRHYGFYHWGGAQALGVCEASGNIVRDVGLEVVWDVSLVGLPEQDLGCPFMGFRAFICIPGVLWGDAVAVRFDVGNARRASCPLLRG